ncbi:hypothetical protein JHK82_038872 [Glycine max]|uniref:Uncharacterized protein n=1 Tax=Glycine max TaxID=3847 RepID=K7M533_SOYBN|nr:hypothetical protein GLYMA_U031324v4 [Glycine max]KAG4953249.1 hypothetical protein JHK87_038843 [Glycine soja]KAG4962183.1 hypothetical protein JHK86_039051 [Glycine max]KAG4964663.1 hypothetical protein JHK85_039638 [Glycine max]KAG5109649.1 hypothetical protein JHK82_038872 [Glycine max]
MHQTLTTPPRTRQTLTTPSCTHQTPTSPRHTYQILTSPRHTHQTPVYESLLDARVGFDSVSGDCGELGSLCWMYVC